MTLNMTDAHPHQQLFRCIAYRAPPADRGGSRGSEMTSQSDLSATCVSTSNTGKQARALRLGVLPWFRLIQTSQLN